MYAARYARKLLSEDEVHELRRSDSWFNEDFQRVFRAYGSNVELSKGQPASSLLSRNEAVYWHGELGRFWYIRHYVFERTEGTSECRFLGFIHRRDPEQLEELKEVRPVTRIPTIAECYLRAPNRLYQAGYHVLSGDFTSYYGVLPLQVTPLVFPHRLFSGWCAHATMHTALVLLSDRGAVPLPMFDINLVMSGAAEFDRPDTVIFDEEPNLNQVKSVVGAPQTRAYATEEFFPGYSADDLASILRGCIRSGMPVIIGVDFEKWKARVSQFQDIAESGERHGKHAIVLVGYRSGRVSEKGWQRVFRPTTSSARFLVHDSYLGPWIEIDAQGLYESAQAYLSDCNAVVASPVGLSVTPSDIGLIGCKHVKRTRGYNVQPSDFRYTLMPRDELLNTCTLIDYRDREEIETMLREGYRDVSFIWRLELLSNKRRHQPLVLFMSATGPARDFFSQIWKDQLFLVDPATRETKVWHLARNLTSA